MDERLSQPEGAEEQIVATIAGHRLVNEPPSWQPPQTSRYSGRHRQPPSVYDPSFVGRRVWRYRPGCCSRCGSKFDDSNRRTPAGHCVKCEIEIGLSD